jgi:hypothetical protein
MPKMKLTGIRSRMLLGTETATAEQQQFKIKEDK